MYKVTLVFKDKTQIINCNSLEQAQEIFNRSGAVLFRVIQTWGGTKEKK